MQILRFVLGHQDLTLFFHKKTYFLLLFHLSAQHIFHLSYELQLEPVYGTGKTKKTTAHCKEKEGHPKHAYCFYTPFIRIQSASVCSVHCIGIHLSLSNFSCHQAHAFLLLCSRNHEDGHGIRTVTEKEE